MSFGSGAYGSTPYGGAPSGAGGSGGGTGGTTVTLHPIGFRDEAFGTPADTSQGVETGTLADAAVPGFYALAGSATLSGESIILTDANSAGNEAGSAFLTEVPLTNINNLQINWTIESDPGGADGWSCAIIDPTTAPSPILGQSGGGKGFAGMACFGFAVEEFGGGTSECFIADNTGGVTAYGSVSESNAAVTGTHEYQMLIVPFFESGDYLMTITRDGTVLFGGELLQGITAEHFILGFTGGTGGTVAAHSVRDISAIIAPEMATILPQGRLDERFGNAPPVITDEAYGLTTLSNAGLGFNDEYISTGTQVVSGDQLAVFYGPLPTSLIINAPYAQVYGPEGSPGTDTITDSGLIVPKFVVARNSARVSNGSAGNTGGSRYRFVITDMMGNVQGEVQQASQKTITQLINNMGVATFTLKVSNPQVDYLLDNPCLCKCYRQPVNRNYAYRLILTGDVTTDEEDTDDETGTITFTVADPLNRLMYRYIGKEMSNGHGTGFVVGTPADPEDIANTIGAMLEEINGDNVLGHSGVTLGIRGPNTPTTYMDAVYFQPFATQLALYTETLDGVDFLLEAQEPYSLSKYPPTPGSNPYLTGGPDPSTPPQRIKTGKTVADTIIAKLNVYFPMGNFLQVEGPPGTYSKGRPYPVFEYGMGKRNVQGYQRIRNRSQMTQRWWSLPDGYPSSNSVGDPMISTDLSTKTNQGTVADSIIKFGGYEQVDQGDLGTNASSLRQKLVDAEAAVTSVPQQQITITPTINCDEDWTIDYFLGDIASVRAYVAEANNGKGSMRFNGSMRIYGIAGSIDDNEQEQIQLTSIPPTASGISGPGD